MTGTRIQATCRKTSKPANLAVQAQAPAAQDSRADIYQRVTDRIAAAIEAGAGKWRMPWHPGVNEAAPQMPVNAATGKPYCGINTVVVWAEAQAESYPSAAWATYRQRQELGAQVRRGEQSSPVVFWRINGPNESEDNGSTGGGGQNSENDRRSRVLARNYSMFNATQVDGYAAPALPVLIRAVSAGSILVLSHFACCRACTTRVDHAETRLHVPGASSCVPNPAVFRPTLAQGDAGATDNRECHH